MCRDDIIYDKNPLIEMLGAHRVAPRGLFSSNLPFQLHFALTICHYLPGPIFAPPGAHLRLPRAHLRPPGPTSDPLGPTSDPLGPTSDPRGPPPTPPQTLWDPPSSPQGPPQTQRPTSDPWGPPQTPRAHLGDFEPIKDPGMGKDFQQNCMGSEPDRTD